MIIQPHTLGHRLLWTLQQLRPDTGAVAALQLACLPDHHPATVASALTGLEAKGLVALGVEHGNIQACRLTAAGEAEAARLGEFAYEEQET